MNPESAQPDVTSHPAAPGRQPQWREEVFGLFVLLLVAGHLLYPMLFDDKTLFYRDFTFITYPFRYFLNQSFQQGVMPYWTPHVYGGMPFLAAFHTGVFYPPSLLFFLEDPIRAINLFYGAHFLIMGIFLYLLGRHWGFSLAARLCSSATGMLSGFLVASTLTSNFFLAGVWLPMIFWMFLKCRKENSLLYFAGTVLAIAAQALAACPEISIMTVGLLCLHQIWFLEKASWKPGLVRLTATLGLAVLLALGLCALQLWPTAELMAHSTRSSGLDYAMHSHWSLPPSKLATLFVSPDYRGHLTSNQFMDRFPPGFLHTLYMGLGGLVSLVLGILFFRNNRAVRLWALVFFAGLFFALGKYNPLYEGFYRLVPFLNLFRFPEKYFYVSAFALVFMTGFVMDEWIRATRNRTARVIPVLVTLMLVAGGVVAAGLQWPGAGLGISLALMTVLGLCYILFYFGRLKSAVFSGVVCCLILVDLSLKDIHLLPLIDQGLYREKPLFMNQLEGSQGAYRVYSGKVREVPDFAQYPNGPSPLKRIQLAKEYMRPYSGMVWGVEQMGIPPGLALGLTYQVQWRQMMERATPEERLRILKRSNIKYWIDQDTPTRYWTHGAPEILPDRIKVFKDSLPRAFLVPAMRVLKQEQLAAAFYHESFHPLQEVLLSEPVEFQPSDRFQGEVQEVRYRPNGVTVRTRQEGNGFLVLLDSYFPGWTVTVDGTEQPILRANGLYRAVQLGPGEHALAFEYFPDGLREGLIVTALSGMALLLLLVLKPLSRRIFPLAVTHLPDQTPHPKSTQPGGPLDISQ